MFSELHKQHQDKLEDITGRFDGIKLTLSEKVETLRSECDRLRDRARSCEDALQRDSDYKVQVWVIAIWCFFAHFHCKTMKLKRLVARIYYEIIIIQTSCRTHFFIGSLNQLNSESNVDQYGV